MQASQSAASGDGEDPQKRKSDIEQTAHGHSTLSPEPTDTPTAGATPFPTPDGSHRCPESFEVIFLSGRNQSQGRFSDAG